MKIIEHGKKAESKQTKQFRCKKCGCVFQCKEDEYWSKPQTVSGMNCISFSAYKTFMTCCPECHKIVEETEYDSINCTYSTTADADKVRLKSDTITISKDSLNQNGELL